MLISPTRKSHSETIYMMKKESYRYRSPILVLVRVSRQRPLEQWEVLYPYF